MKKVVNTPDRVVAMIIICPSEHLDRHSREPITNNIVINHNLIVDFRVTTTASSRISYLSSDSRKKHIPLKRFRRMRGIRIPPRIVYSKCFPVCSGIVECGVKIIVYGSHNICSADRHWSIPAPQNPKFTKLLQHRQW